MRYVQDPQWGEVYVDDASGTIYRPYSDEGGTTLGFLGNYNSDVRFDSLKPVSTPAPAPAPAADPFAAVSKPEWVASSDPYFNQFTYQGEFGEENPYTSTIAGLQAPENWRSVAGQLGYQGPFETQVISSDPAEGGGGYATVTAPEFQQFIEQKKAEGYDFVTKGDQIDKDRQTIGLMTPTGDVTNQTPVKVSGFDDFLKEFVLPSVAAYGAVNFFGPHLEGLTSSLGGPGQLTASDLAGVSSEVSASSVPQAAFPPIESKITPVSTPAAAATDAAKAAKLSELKQLGSIMQGPTAPAMGSLPQPLPPGIQELINSPTLPASAAAPALSSVPIFDLGGNAIDPFTSEILSPASVVPAGSVMEGMIPGGLKAAGISPTLGELAAVGTVASGGSDVLDLVKKYGGKAFDTAKDVLSSPAGLVGLGALLSYLDKQPARGGGYTGVASGARPTARTTVQGPYGPIVRYAANGGLMQAYAQGGVVTGTHQRPMQMEDGGFVMTERAVKGAGGPQGIAQLLPDAKLIRGPGTGTSDDIPATIEGNTPARVSNGEMYVPRAQVKQAGGAPALYALMNKLQRRA